MKENPLVCTYFSFKTTKIWRNKFQENSQHVHLTNPEQIGKDGFFRWYVRENYSKASEEICASLFDEPSNGYRVQQTKT